MEEEINKTKKGKRYKTREKGFVKSKRKKRILKIIEILLILGILLSLIYLVKWGIDGYKAKKAQDELKQYIKIDELQENQEIKEKQENKTVIDFDALIEKNKHTKGWLKINGTNIDHPIVQAKNNSYYVRKSFDRTYNFGGWPFFDYRNSLDGKDKNIIIYGHNMRNGTMFHDLRYSFDKKWYGKEENQIITLYTLTEEKQYKIFSMYKVPSEEYYITTDFTDSEFKNFLKTINSRSKINFKQNLDNVEQILTLSTCDYNLKNRIVIHAAEIKNID